MRSSLLKRSKRRFGVVSFAFVVAVVLFSTTLLESCDLLFGRQSSDNEEETDTVPSLPIQGDWPIIPQPAAAYEDTPATSEALTVIVPLTSEELYEPKVLRAKAEWSGDYRFETFLGTEPYAYWVEEPVPYELGEFWSDEIPLLVFATDLPCVVQASWVPDSWNIAVGPGLPAPHERLLLVDGGVPVTPGPIVRYGARVPDDYRHPAAPDALNALGLIRARIEPSVSPGPVCLQTWRHPQVRRTRLMMGRTWRKYLDTALHRLPSPSNTAHSRGNCDAVGRMTAGDECAATQR